MLKAGHGSGAIISPRDMKKDERLQELVTGYKATNTELLIDPQLYTSDNVQNNTELPNFDSTIDWAKPEVGRPILQDSMQRQIHFAPSRYIVPGPFTPAVTDSWLKIIRDFSEDALEMSTGNGNNGGLYATIAISANIVEHHESRLKLLNSISGLPVDGFYLVSDVPSQPANSTLLYGILDIVFRLKRNGFHILMGYTEPWALLTFPMGLDGFASSGLKNRRSFTQGQWRNSTANHGWSPQFVHFWSPLLLDKIKFPHEADVLAKKGIWKQIYGESPYAMVLHDREPSNVYETKQWTKQDSFNNYSWMMCHIATQFRSLDYGNRVERVREWVQSAKVNIDQLNKIGLGLNSKHLEVWLGAFNQYVADTGNELRDEFD